MKRSEVLAKICQYISSDCGSPKYIKSFEYIKDVAYSNVEVNEWEPENGQDT